MNNKPIYYLFLISALIKADILFSRSDSKDSSRINRTIQHNIYFGISKSNYFFSRAKSIFSEYQKSIDNTHPSYSICYEPMMKVYRQLHVGIGLSYHISSFNINYSNFINPNLLNGIVSVPMRHEYLAVPLNIYWKFPVSSKSSLLVYSGVESFKTTVFKQVETAYVSAYKSNGTSDNSADIKSQFDHENFSFFRTFNTGIRFQINEKSRNRIVLGVNYYLMKNYFPLNTHSFIFIGNKNYEVSDHLYFEGLKFQIGYLW